MIISLKRDGIDAKAPVAGDFGRLSTIAHLGIIQVGINAEVFKRSIFIWFIRIAAYYNPTLNGGAGGYTTYATQSDDLPGNLIGVDFNQVNYLSEQTGYSVTEGFNANGGFRLAAPL